MEATHDSALALEALKLATERAETAAARAEKASVRPRYWLVAGLLFAFVGAVLAFALRDSGASVLGVRLQPLGGVLFGAGALLLIGAAIESMGNGNSGGDDSTTVKSIGGLIAVGLAVTAVTALAIVTLTQLDDDKSSVVAVTSSAFGIISAVVGAYLGIKITSDTNGNATDEAKRAAVARREAAIANRKYDAVQKAAGEKLAPEDAAMIKAVGDAAAEEASRTPDPPVGGVQS